MVTDDGIGAVPGTRLVLVVGDAAQCEMQRLFVWLQGLVAGAQKLVTIRDVAGISRELGDDEFPDLVIVLQCWPDEFSLRQANELFTFAPLARVVVCYGAWCESDGRNRDNWPRSVRVPLWAARSRIEREWRLIQAPETLSPLPWSASREEIFLADHPPITLSSSPRRVFVDSPDSEYRRFLIEQLTAVGHALAADNPSALIFDVDPWNDTRLKDLIFLHERFSGTKIYALASLPQHSLECELIDLGVTSLLPKLGNALNESLSLS